MGDYFPQNSGSIALNSMSYCHFVRKIYFPLTEFIKGEKVNSYFKLLKGNEHRSIDELRSQQWNKLLILLKFSSETIPYYSLLFKKHSINIEDIRSPEDFEKIPLLSKDIIRSESSSLYNESYSNKIYSGKTSGSTGIPLNFYVTPEYSSWDWASRWRARNWFGVHIGDPEVAIWGRPLNSQVQRIKDIIKARIRNTLLISGFEFSEEVLEKHFHRILRFQPYYLYGYSSSIYHLALYIHDQHPEVKLKNLRAVFVTAETLLPYQRKLVEDIFHVPVSNEYGCSEIGGFAYECPASNWHVSIENVFLEFVNNEFGQKEVIATSLTNYYMPFIRYRIGDHGNWDYTVCPCGCSLPIMKLRTGKITDRVVLSNGIIYSSEIFDYLNLALLDLQHHPFKQYQVIQTKLSYFTIRYVPDETFSNSDILIFRKIFSKTIPDTSIQLQFEPVSEIKPDSSGKIRYFISNIKTEV